MSTYILDIIHIFLRENIKKHDPAMSVLIILHITI